LRPRHALPPWRAAYSVSPMSRLDLLPMYPVCTHFDVVHLALRSRNGYTVFAHALEMKLDGLADLSLHLLQRLSRGNAARKVRDIGRVVVLGLLDHDRVSHVDLTSSVRPVSGCC